MLDFNKLYEYYIILFFEVNYKDTSFLSDKKYDLDEIYNYAIEFWYKCFDEKLDITKDENKDKLFAFLNRIFQYKLLNDNLKLVYNNATNNEQDNFVVNNFDKIADLVKDNLSEINNYSNIDVGELPKLSHVELDKLFTEFLLCIDKSKDMLKTYLELKENNKFIFLDILDKDERHRIKKLLNITDEDYNDYFMRTASGDGFIIMDRQNNIGDLRILAHEFMHYYTFSKNKEAYPNFLVIEFPSIFFEILMCNFLIDKEYDTDKVIKLSGLRLNQINDMSLYAFAVNYYIDLYIKNGEVNKEHDLDRLKELLIEKKISDKKEFDNLDEVAGNYCDFSNYYLAVDQNILNKSYSYIIGNYLALKHLNKFYQNELSMEEMINITKDLPNIDLYTLFDFDKSKEKKNK